jgi:very-short-patch-repair endonuclease
LPLIAEIDSDRFHAAPLDAAADAKRDDDMRRAGFEVVRFTESEVWYKPREVVGRWREMRREVRRRLAS